MNRVCPMHLYKVELTVHKCLQLWCRQFNEFMIKLHKAKKISSHILSIGNSKSSQYITNLVFHAK